MVCHCGGLTHSFTHGLNQEPKRIFASVQRNLAHRQTEEYLWNVLLGRPITGNGNYGVHVIEKHHRSIVQMSDCFSGIKK